MNQNNNLDKYLNCTVRPESGREQVKSEIVSYMQATVPGGRTVHTHASSAIIPAIIAIVVTAIAGTALLTRGGVDVQWNRVCTGANEKLRINLPDSSTIWLNSESEIFYPERFRGKERKVFVSGEAYASISKDAKHPFVVEAEGMKINVHGTRFNVKAYRDTDSREVFLEEGSVSLTFGRKGNSILMVPNDLVRYSVSQDTMEKFSVSPQSIPDWRTCRSLSFVNMKISDIIPELKRFFNTDIILAGDVSTQTRVYASFINGEDIYEILNAINTDNKLKISQVEDCILISKNK